MKKLKLVPGDLRVESFPTRRADDRADGGTVQAHEWVLTPKCVYTDPAETCWCTERGCP